MTSARPIFAAMIIAGAAWITSPGGGQLNIEKCSPSGSLAALSERIHGAGFWRAQLPSIAVQLEKAEHWDEYEAGAQARAADGERQAREFLDGFYEQHPDLAPTPGLRAAQRLRNRADQIEEAESRQFISDFMHRDALMLAKCRAIITAKSEIR